MAVEQSGAEIEGMAEDHDVFVSYSSSDDRKPVDADRGWVSRFVEELKTVLQRKLGRDAKVWMGLVEANRPATERLLQLVSGSRVMVVVLSPGYCQSDWCRRELATFVADAQRRGQRYAVFPVLVEDIDWREWPLHAQSLTPINFLQQRRDSSAKRLAGYPKPVEDEPFYWDRTTELADLIKQHLKGLPASPPTARRQTVVLAEPADDVDHLHAEMTSALKQRGDVVLLPPHPYVRRNASEYDSGVRHALRNARLHVQLLSASPGTSLAGGERIVTLQARLAAEQAAASGMKSMRWWLPPAPDFKAEHIADAALRALLEDPATSRLPFEQFRMSVLRAIDELVAADAEQLVHSLRHTTPAVAPPAPPSPPPAATVPPTTAVASSPSDGARLLVYLHAAPEDAANAERISEHLENDADVMVLRSPEPRPDVSYLDSLQEQEDALGQCHGELVLYGHSKVASVSFALLYAQRVFGVRGRRVPQAVLDLPPHDKPALNVRDRSLLRIDCRAGFEPGLLAPFYQALRQGQRRA